MRGTRGNPVAMSAFTLTTMFVIPIGLGTVIMNGREGLHRAHKVQSSSPSGMLND